MTLDEAIEHANQVADSYKDTVPACKCAHEHRQLADWLTELKVLRDENARLLERITTQKQTIQSYRDESREWRGVADARGRTIDRISVENAKLRELAESRGWIARMLGEQTARVVNLQELAQDMFDGMCDHDHCMTCDHWQDGYNGCKYHAAMRELGVEVDK